MHPIAQYIEDRQMTQTEFAKRLGVSPQTLNDVLKGRSFLGRSNSLAVVAITDGAITLEALMTWTPDDKTAA